MKIFLDANILIAAAGSETGAARYLWYIAEQDPRWQLVTSAYAIGEARVNVTARLPTKQEQLSFLITHSALTVVQQPNRLLFKRIAGLVPEKDEPILAAALSCSATVLVTLDQKDFHNPMVKNGCKKWGLQILLPGDLLKRWRAEQL